MAVIETPAVEAPHTPQAPEVPARKQAVSDYTRDLLLQVRDKILEEPEQFRMRYWVWNGYDCGTAACIGGHAALLCNQDRNSLIERQNAGALNATYFAGVLGILPHGNLFHVPRWPEPFRSAYRKNYRDEANDYDGDKEMNASVRAEVAAARIMHFIETGE